MRWNYAFLQVPVLFLIGSWKCNASDKCVHLINPLCCSLQLLVEEWLLMDLLHPEELLLLDDLFWSDLMLLLLEEDLCLQCWLRWNGRRKR